MLRSGLLATTTLALFGTAAYGAGKTNYEEHVVPILRTHCGNCHNPDKSKGDLNVMTYAGLLAGGSSGAAVEAGAADGSRLYKLSAHLEEPKMPPSGTKIPAKDLEVLKQWINEGLLEKSGGQAKVSKKPKMDLTVASAAGGNKPAGPAPMPGRDYLMEPYVRTPRPGLAYSIASSPWGPLLAVGGQKQVLLLHSDTLAVLGVLPFPEGQPYVVKFSRNGALVLAAGGVAGKQGKVVVYKVDTGERVIEVGDESDAVLAADISADQSMVAVGGSNKLVKIYSTKDGELLHTMKKHTEWVLTLEFSPDGVLLASGDRNGGVVVWESGSGREFYTLAGHTAAITALSWRMDSNVLATGSEDTTIRLWEMQNGTQVKSWGAHGGGVLSLMVTHDGRIASAGRDKVAKTWKPDGNAERQFEGFGDLATRVTFNQDGSKVICGDWTGLLRSWNAKDGKRIVETNTNPPTLDERIASANKLLEQKKGETTPVETAAKAALAAAAAVKQELAAAQAELAAAGVEEKTLVAKQGETKGKFDKAKAESDQAKAAVAAKQKQAGDMTSNAQAVKEALASAVAAEKMLQAIEAQQQQAQASLADLVAKTKAASARVGGDGAVKTALGRGESSLVALNLAKEAAKKQLADASQLTKELTEASARHNQTADKVAAEMALLDKDAAAKAAAFAQAEKDAKAAADGLVQAIAKKKGAEAKIAQKTPAAPAAEKAAAEAEARRKATAAAQTELVAEIEKLKRAKVYGALYWKKADFDAKQARAVKLAESVAQTKQAAEKAKLALAEFDVKLPKLEGEAKAKDSVTALRTTAASALESEIKAIQAQVAERAAMASTATEMATKLAAAVKKNPADKMAKEALDKATAAAQAVQKRAAELAPQLQAKQAALAKAQADRQAAVAEADKAKTAAAAAKKEREQLPKRIEKNEARTAEDAKALAAAQAEVAASKSAVDQLSKELAAIK